MTGLLIVNADDWGADAAGTERIERAFAAGAITSTTAMVHMSGSAAGAGLAAERGRPTGLHLNLTEPFDGPGVPPAVRERQRRACALLAPLPRRRWVPAAGPRMHMRRMRGSRRCDPHLPDGAGSSASHGCR